MGLRPHTSSGEEFEEGEPQTLLLGAASASAGAPVDRRTTGKSTSAGAPVETRRTTGKSTSSSDRAAPGVPPVETVQSRRTAPARSATYAVTK